MNPPAPVAAAFRDRVIGFVMSLEAGSAGAFRFRPGGETGLYASCFAALTLHTLDALDAFPPAYRQAWAEHIRACQRPDTGLFVGPESRDGDPRADTGHDAEYAARHLTVHALPALDALDSEPRSPAVWAHPYLHGPTLREWLALRDWRKAWLEGNRLLFVGIGLTQAREKEQRAEGDAALRVFFDWLDAEQDARTGLWGTDGHCDAYEALYGAYHQLLVYYYCGRSVPHAERALDATLRLQHADGSFMPYGGGGTCEDVDGIDVVVNLYRRTGHRPRAVRWALRRAADQLLKQQTTEGGFLYRRGKPFDMMNLARTRTPADVPELFSTWFRAHALGLICETLGDHPLSPLPWRFNRTCSMGWHDTGVRSGPRCEPLRDRLPFAWHWAELAARKIRRRVRGGR